MSNVKVIKVNARHRRTSVGFERWLAKNPDADLNRQVQAFNAIADTDFQQVLNERKQKIEPKRLTKKR